jgi:hypothetical protein
MKAIKHAIITALAVFSMLMISYTIVLVFCFIASLPIPYADTFRTAHWWAMGIVIALMCFWAFALME